MFRIVLNTALHWLTGCADERPPNQIPPYTANNLEAPSHGGALPGEIDELEDAGVTDDTIDHDPEGGDTDLIETKSPKQALEEILLGLCDRYNECQEDLEEPKKIDRFECLSQVVNSPGAFRQISDELGFEEGDLASVERLYNDATGESFLTDEGSLTVCIESFWGVSCNQFSRLSEENWRDIENVFDSGEGICDQVFQEQ